MSTVERRPVYGLQVANRLRVEKITVYRSCVGSPCSASSTGWWEDQDVATADGRPRRRLYSLNQHGRSTRSRTR